LDERTLAIAVDDGEGSAHRCHTCQKTAGLDRVRELLRTLPPEVSAKLDQKELNTGVAVMTKKKMPDNKAVIQSPSDGIYSWNGSNAMTGPEVLKRLAQLAMA
jgi:hypothetical protein